MPIIQTATISRTITGLGFAVDGSLLATVTKAEGANVISNESYTVSPTAASAILDVVPASTNTATIRELIVAGIYAAILADNPALGAIAA